MISADGGSAQALHPPWSSSSSSYVTGPIFYSCRRHWLPRLFGSFHALWIFSLPRGGFLEFSLRFLTGTLNEFLRVRLSIYLNQTFSNYFFFNCHRWRHFSVTSALWEIPSSVPIIFPSVSLWLCC